MRKPSLLKKRWRSAPPLTHTITSDNSLPYIDIDGRHLHMQPKTRALWNLIVTHQGHVVPYETIYSALWPNSIVEFAQIYQQKKMMNNAFGFRIARCLPKCGLYLDCYPYEVIVIAAQGT